MIFVNSMSDLFHKEVPFSFIDRVFDTMETAQWHKFQILTKRSSRLCKYVNARYADGSAPPHIWLGTSSRGWQARNRARRHIQATKASVRFLSIEPLLGPVGKIDLEGIHWVIVGGESGPGRGRCWRNGRCECATSVQAAKVPFFFKQWGGLRPKSGGRLLDGREWSQWPKTQVNNGPVVGGTCNGSAKADHLAA